MNGRSTKPQRSAFTLVELLVVISIIGILMAMILPAVQSAREAGRRTQCLNNLKQLGLAALSYVQAKNTFPPGKVVTGYPGNGTQNMSCWTLEILPFLEEKGLFDRYDFSKPNVDVVNRPVVSTPLPMMACPSDVNAAQLAIPEPEPNYGEWATGSYRAISGIGYFQNTTNTAQQSFYGGYVKVTAPLQISDRGIMTVTPAKGFNHAEISKLFAPKMAHVRDGTSKTMLIGEYSAHTLITRSVFWAKSYFAQNSGAIFVDVDNIVFSPDYQQCLDAIPNNNAPSPCKITIASLHNGGEVIQFAFADGSNRSISSLTEINVLRSLATMAGGETEVLP